MATTASPSLVLPDHIFYTVKQQDALTLVCSPSATEMAFTNANDAIVRAAHHTVDRTRDTSLAQPPNKRMKESTSLYTFRQLTTDSELSRTSAQRAMVTRDPGVAEIPVQAHGILADAQADVHETGTPMGGTVAQSDAPRPHSATVSLFALTAMGMGLRRITGVMDKEKSFAFRFFARTIS